MQFCNDCSFKDYILVMIQRHSTAQRQNIRGREVCKNCGTMQEGREHCGTFNLREYQKSKPRLGLGVDRNEIFLRRTREIVKQVPY